MPIIKWIGIIKSEDEFPIAEIPPSAIKMEVEEDMKKMQMKAIPFMIPSCLLCIICMVIKTAAANERVIHFGFLFIGILIGFLLIFVHELLHAIAFPKNAIVLIGIMPRCLSAVALSSSPVSRNRFIFLSILPIVLGIIPLLIFCVSDKNLIELNGIMFGMAIMGMITIYPDIYNIFHILKVVPQNAILQNNKNETYFYSDESSTIIS